MFWQRALITFTLGPLALAVIYLGGLYYFLPIMAILLLATWEYHQLMHRLGYQTTPWILALVAAVLLSAQWLDGPHQAAVLMGAFLLSMMYALWLYEGRRSQRATSDWVVMVGGVVLLGWIGSHFLRLRALEEMAWQWTMLAMLGTWLADSAAYVVGRFLAGRAPLGRHPMAPRLSPNKTVEGYVGGIILGTAATLVIAVWLQLPLTAALTLGLFVSVISPVGDLGISLLKREAGVKDSGHLFGGHGGALDRIDSLLWSVTFAYYLAFLLS